MGEFVRWSVWWYEDGSFYTEKTTVPADDSLRLHWELHKLDALQFEVGADVVWEIEKEAGKLMRSPFQSRNTGDLSLSFKNGEVQFHCLPSRFDPIEAIVGRHNNQDLVRPDPKRPTCFTIALYPDGCISSEWRWDDPRPQSYWTEGRAWEQSGTRDDTIGVITHRCGLSANSPLHYEPLT